MADHDGGSVGIDILPKIDAAQWGQEIKRRLDPVLNRAGERGGAVYGTAFKREAERRMANISATVRATLDESSVTRVQERLAEIGPVTVAVKPEINEAALRRVQERLARAGPVTILVDPKLNEAELQRIQQRNRGLGPFRATIFPKLDEWALLRVQQRLSSLGPFKVTIQAEADTARASAELARLQAQIRLLSRSNVRINVSANAAAATSQLVMLGIQMAALASIPLGATIAAGIGAIGAAATAATAGFGGLLAVAIPGVRRVSEALQAQKTADNQVAASTRGRTTALHAGTIATLQAKVQAAQMAQAERQVTQAQQSARQAQRDLTQARVDGTRALQDMQNNLIDAGLSLRGDEIAVQRAKQALDQLTSARQDAVAVQRAQADLARSNAGLQLVLGDPNATQLAKDQAKLAVDSAAAALKQARESQAAHELDRKEAQLAYEQAVQQLKQQRILYERLRVDEAKARKAGVEGTREVVAAKERLRDALEQVAAAQRNVRLQQIQDRIAALQQADAQRQASDAADGATAANVRLGRAMAALTPAEKSLLRNWQAFRKVYRDWVKDLEPDVLPVLSGGLGLVGSQLDGLQPMVRSSAAAFRLLEARAAIALDGPFWPRFIARMSIEAPHAILGFGSIAGSTLTGVAGIFEAFLPYTNLLLGSVDALTGRFERWGTGLAGSNGFIEFISFIQTTGPQVVHTLGSLGSSLIDIGRALAPLAAVQLMTIRFLAEGLAALARTNPELIQLAAAAFLVTKAIRVLGFTSLIAGLTGTGAAAGAASGGMLRFAATLRVLGGAMMGVRGAAVTTRIALLGLTKLGAVVGTVAAVGWGVNQLQDRLMGTVQPVNELTTSMMKLAETGKFTGAFTEQFKGSMLTGRDSVQEFKRAADEIVDPTWMQKWVDHPFADLTHWLSFGTYDTALSKYKEDFKQLDTTLNSMAQNGKAEQAAAAFSRMSGELQKSGLGIHEINTLFPQYTAMVGSGAYQTQIFTQRIREQNQALSANARAFANDQQEVIDFNNSLAAGRAALSSNGRAFWGNSQAATNNRQTILQAARVLQNYSDDLIANNRVTDGSIRRLRGQREQLIQLAEKFGLSRKEAAKYVDQLVKIPKSASTEVGVNAKGKFRMKGMETLVPGTILESILGGKAGGGYIGGGGGPRDDGHLTRISAGEMVVNAPATARYLPWLTAINDEGNAGTIYKGQGYTTGPALATRPAAVAGSDGAFAGGGLLDTCYPHFELPAFAAGGLLKPSWSSHYRYQEDPAPTLTKARKGNTKGLTGMVGYAAGQTAVGATILTAILTGGYGKGAKAVAFAKQQLGEPYVWGATGPNTWDCSGLTMRAWGAAGVRIPRVTYDQIAYGTPTTRSRAMPGDLYFPHRGHVMMVTGMGGARALIHAPRTGDVVRYAGWRSGGKFRHIAGGGGSWYGGGTPKGFAKAQLGDLGWSSAQFAPLNRLWERESGWRWNARNRSSGAYGIPQALPPSKMASFGSDWRTNWATQIRWGLNYIKQRYGSPSRAWAHSQRTGWYADGTQNARRGWGWVGERGPELVNFRGGEAVYPHEDSVRMAAAAAVAPLELSDAALAPVGGDHYHAHFDGTTRASVQHEVRTGFQAMQMAQAQSLRIGRRG